MADPKTAWPVALVNPPERHLINLPGPVLVLGPAYSGKSEFATKLVAPDPSTTVLGTASPETLSRSHGLTKRIEQLQASRPSHWHHQSINGSLPEHLSSTTTAQVVVDSLNLWVGNLIATASQTYNEDDITAHLWSELNALTKQLGAAPADQRLVLVSGEVGGGIPPEDGVGRLYRQSLGRLNQLLAAHCASVLQLTAGIATVIKPQYKIGD